MPMLTSLQQDVSLHNLEGTAFEEGVQSRKAVEVMVPMHDSVQVLARTLDDVSL